MYLFKKRIDEPALSDMKHHAWAADEPEYIP